MVSQPTRARTAKARRSAGILMYKRADDGVRLLLIHPGGPFWARRDAGAWSIPKGEFVATADPLAAAIREFTEETGIAPHGDFWPLGEVVQPGRKIVLAFAVEGEFDADALRSNLFEMEWPPRSGRTAAFPEVDRAAWFSPEEAREKLLVGQRPFIDRLLAGLAGTAATRD